MLSDEYPGPSKRSDIGVERRDAHLLERNVKAVAVEEVATGEASTWFSCGWSEFASTV